LRFHEVQITLENRVRQIITSTLAPVKKRLQPENDMNRAMSLMPSQLNFKSKTTRHLLSEAGVESEL
jgi:hypothetical protein